MAPRALLATAALATVLVAGCGGGDEGESSPAGPAGSAAATIEDFEYAPARITVATGAEVAWTNEDTANHTVTFSEEGIKGIDNLRQGQKGSVTFAEAGEYAYVCTFHPNMRGTVVVE